MVSGQSLPISQLHLFKDIHLAFEGIRQCLRSEGKRVKKNLIHKNGRGFQTIYANLRLHIPIIVQSYSPLPSLDNILSIMISSFKPLHVHKTYYVILYVGRGAVK